MTTPSEAVDRIAAILRCGHGKEFYNVLPNVGDVETCDMCNTITKVWLTPGVSKYHCSQCKSASRSLIPSVIRGQAAQHAYKLGHTTLVYVEGKEADAERIEGRHGTTSTTRKAHQA